MLQELDYPSQVEHDYAEVEFHLPHITIKGLRGGTPGGPLLLLLHGWLDNCHSFLPMMPHLQDCDWIAIDFPGHGHSAHRSADAQYYFVDWVYDVESLIRQQNWHNVHLLGHSMGGFVAQLLAATFPTSVKSVMSIEAFGLVTGQAEDALEQLRKGFVSRFKQQDRKLPVYSDLQHVRHARAKAGDFDEALADLLLQRNLRAVEGGYSWRTDPRVRSVSPFRFTAEQVPAILQGIQVPLLVILGEHGHTNLVEALQRWRCEVSQIEVVTLPGGHHLHMQSADLVASAVVQQLTRLTSEA